MPKEADWELKQVDQSVVDKLITNLDISRLTAEILARRGFTSASEVKRFLQFTAEDLHDPYLLADIDLAAERIFRAIAQQEKIVIYGDYDVDGITSTALLMDYIYSLGGNVDYYIPNRLEEGYGLNRTAIKELAAQGLELLITVDCGIKAQTEINLARKLGSEVIVTDHHTPPAEKTSALAVVNPTQERCDYPWPYLSGVGVAFKLVQALAARDRLPNSEFSFTTYLSLTSLGTIADIVPLQGENRIIASCGLDQLNSITAHQQPGLTALANVAGFGEGEIKAGNVAYQLAPRINAAGRLGEPETAVKLLLAKNSFTAQEFANQLNKLNNRRKEISERIFSEAEAAIRGVDLTEEWVLVLASPHWHSGVIGNVASDLQEKYHRPVVLIALNKGEKGPGSCRSISSFNIYRALEECSDLLIDFGGHKQAAGFSIAAKNISNLRRRLNQIAKDKLVAKDLRPRRRVDNEVELSELSFSLLEELEALAPFGYKNPRPVLKLTAAEIDSFRLVGSNNNHLKLLVSKNKCQMEGIGFGQAEHQNKLQLQQKNVDLLFQLDRNEWQGQVNLQLKIKDMKVPSPSFKKQLFNFSFAGKIVESKYDWFYLFLSVTNCSLEVGQELKLEHQSGKVLIIGENQRIAELDLEFAGQLGNYLDLGISYQAVVVAKTPETINLFISRNLGNFSSLGGQFKAAFPSSGGKQKIINQIETEVLTGSLSKRERKVIDQLSVGNAKVEVSVLFNRLPLVKAVSLWQTLTRSQLTVIAVSTRHLAVNYYWALKRSLQSKKIDCWLGTGNLSLQEEVELKRGLSQKEIDILVATPEFIAQNQALFSAGLLVVDQDLEGQVGVSELTPERKVTFHSLNSERTETSVSIAQEPKVQLQDKRNLTNKVEYLESLLDDRTKVLIYVVDSELSRKLAADLDTPQQEVLFYTSQLSPAVQEKVTKKFSTNQVTGLVATTDLLIEGIEITDVVFYQPGFSRFQFIQQLSQLTNQDLSDPQLHLLYSSEAVDKTKRVINEKAPNREVLKDLYILLFKLSKNQVNVTYDKLRQLWCQHSDYSGQKRILSTLLGIFSELGLVKRIKEEKRKIRLTLQSENQLDLTNSMRYNEGVRERKQFAQFVSSVLMASKQKISTLI